MSAEFWMSARRRVFGLLAIGSLTCGLSLTPPVTAQADESPSKAGDSEAKADIYTVPEGTPAELMDYVDMILSRKTAKAADDRDLHTKKAYASASKALDKIVASEKSGKRLLVEAVTKKIRLLQDMEKRGDETAHKQLEQFADRLAGDKRPLLSGFGHQIQIELQWQAIADNPDESTKADQKKLLADTVAYAGSGDAEPEKIQLAMNVLQVLQYLAPTETADAYEELAKVAAKSPNEQVAEFSEQFEGAARRLRLPGHPIRIEGETLEGQKLDWDAYKGKVVLIDFWATWCPLCIREIPNIRKEYQQYHDRGFEVVAISLDEKMSTMKRFLENEELPWINIVSSDAEKRGWSDPIAHHYGIMALPASILVGADGKVVALNVRGPDLGRWLKKLIGPAGDEAEDAKKDAAGSSK
ncbi:MAG TPA: TlpA disulfide reductase family protein [Planctomycetaceae bacterium]|nr:TlpA disulfide reductase family protein [Planctomycetaceae bacterium]